MIKQLTMEEQESLHLCYRNNELFRHWSPTLCRLEWEMQELDSITLWREVEKVLLRLKSEKYHREEMIQYLFGRMMKDFRAVEDEFGEKRIRTVEQAECSAVTVMCIVLTLLMNTVEKGHEEEGFNHQPICVAIVGWLRSHPHFQFLMDDFFARQRGFDGKMVTFTPSDPLDATSKMEAISEEMRKEIEDMVQLIIGKTQNLQRCFEAHWENWKQLWSEVCLDNELFLLLKKVNPNKNDWSLNQKMICNVIGLFRDSTKIGTSISEINNMISGKNLGSYLRNHISYGTTDCALNKEQHKKIESIINGFYQQNINC